MDGVNNWFNYYEEKVQELGVLEDEIFNFDEKGFQLGSPDSEYCVFLKKVGPLVSAASSSSSWITAIECVFATGKTLKPLIVYVGKQPTTD